MSLNANPSSCEGGTHSTAGVAEVEHHAVAQPLDGLATVLHGAALHQPRERRRHVSGFQARPLYEWAGYELVGRVEDFPSGADALWYRKCLNPPEVAQEQARDRS